MKLSSILVLCLLLANTAAFAAQKCPTIETSMLGKGFSEAAPWRVMSGGAGECSFMTASTSINFGFNHMAAESPEAASAAAVEMKGAVAATSVIEPMLVLGDEGFTYQPKKDGGGIDRTSMFFYGHRGSLNVSGYLNLKDAITPAQRDFAANLLTGTLGAASHPDALAKEADCPYFDAAIVKRLLTTGSVSMILPDASNCIASAAGKVITLSIVRSARSRTMAAGMLKEGGCTVDAVPKLGPASGILHHCREGNLRAEALFLSRGRMFRLVYVPGGEPSPAERATLAELAEFAAQK